MKPIQSRGLFRVFAVLFVLFNILLPVSCQTASTGNGAAAGATAVEPVWDGVPGEFKAAVVGALKPGEPFVVAAAGKGIPEESARMRAVLVKGDTTLNRGTFFAFDAVSGRGPVRAAVMAVPSTVTAGAALIRIEAAGKVLQTINLTIEERTFTSESFAITGAMTDILTKPDPEKTRQAEQMWAIWAKTGNEIFTTGNFVMPVVSNYQTSIFGTRRVYRYPNGKSSSSIHAGVDWRAPTGTPITAPAPGRVALAMNRISTGNTIVIEHMPGVYSLYYHMDKLVVSAGDMVKAGTRLGDAGATGFATGAHLHYEIRVATENTDPATFQGRTILDKDAILAILNE